MIELYNSEKHYELISSWYNSHDQKTIPSSSLPKIGYIVNNIVAGFLYQTDSDICLIENFISKKDSNKEERRRSIDILFLQLIESAKEMGFKKIMSIPTNSRLEQDHSKWGFTLLDKTCKIAIRSL